MEDQSSLLTTLFYNRLITDTELTSMLAVVTDDNEATPTVFQGTAPDGCPTPYVTFIDNITPDDSDFVERVTFTVDVYDNNGSSAAVRKIAARIQQLFQLTRDESGTVLSTWKDAHGVVLGSHPNEQHYTMYIMMRVLRKDLL